MAWTCGRFGGSSSARLSVLRLGLRGDEIQRLLYLNHDPGHIPLRRLPELR